MINKTDGELRLENVANPMPGGAVVAKVENSEAVANSQNYRKRAKPRIKTTSKLSREQDLSILRDFILTMRDDGFDVEVGNFSGKSGKKSVLVVLKDVEIKSGKFTEVQAE